MLDFTFLTLLDNHKGNRVNWYHPQLRHQIKQYTFVDKDGQENEERKATSGQSQQSEPMDAQDSSFPKGGPVSRPKEDEQASRRPKRRTADFKSAEAFYPGSRDITVNLRESLLMLSPIGFAMPPRVPETRLPEPEPAKKGKRKAGAKSNDTGNCKDTRPITRRNGW